MSRDVALLCGTGDSSAAVANALRREFGDVAILVEEKESRKTFLRRRIRRLGLTTVVGQLAFVVLSAALRRRSRARITEIAAAGGLDTDRSCLEAAARVRSVNSPEALDWLRRERPKVVVVNGTRIIARRVLEAMEAPFINTHCGITPQYRGSHGGYWALSRGDRENCGVTVHLIDPGIDTGAILAQAPIRPRSCDNFATYPYLQLAAGLPLLIEAVRSALRGELSPRSGAGESGLWYHPTLWAYLATGLRRSVW